VLPEYNRQRVQHKRALIIVKEASFNKNVREYVVKADTSEEEEFSFFSGILRKKRP
jgi:hypothetical protein